MIMPISSDSTVYKYIALHQTLRGLNTGSVLHARDRIGITDTENDEIVSCLTYLAKNVDEELLPKVITLFAAIQAKDNNLAYHSARVCMYSAKIGEKCGIEGDELTALLTGALLHDTGKLRFPDYLFQNQGKLSPNEMKIIRQHPESGEIILREQRLDYFPNLTKPVRSHHENIDGTGYPDGIKGLRIPLLAMIVKLADCLDAMTEERSYQQSLPIDVALEKLYDARNKEFDPDLVKIMEKIIEDLPKDEMPLAKT